MIPWAREFYARQAAWGQVYAGPVTPRQRARAAWVRARVGAAARRALDLGAGGGQNALALAEEGFAVTAVEQVPALARAIRQQIAAHSQAAVTLVEADFYQVALPAAAFDIVVYWDGFGLGDDAAQRVLLRRIRHWLQPAGWAFLEVYTPWHAWRTAGLRQRVGRAWREYGFDPNACRWLDRWWLEETGEEVVQSLRCYTPADLHLLLEGTGLRLAAVHPGGWPPERPPLAQAMSFIAVLRPTANETPVAP